MSIQHHESWRGRSEEDPPCRECCEERWGPDQSIIDDLEDAIGSRHQENHGWQGHRHTRYRSHIARRATDPLDVSMGESFADGWPQRKIDECHHKPKSREYLEWH